MSLEKTLLDITKDLMQDSAFEWIACFLVQDGETMLKKVTDLNIISDGAEFKDLCAFLSRYVKLHLYTRYKGFGLFYQILILLLHWQVGSCCLYFVTIVTSGHEV